MPEVLYSRSLVAIGSKCASFSLKHCLWGVAVQVSTEYCTRCCAPQQINALGSSTSTCFFSPCKTSAPVNNPEQTINRAGSNLEQTTISDQFSGVSEANILKYTIMLGDFLNFFKPYLPRAYAKLQREVLRISHLGKRTSFWSRRHDIYCKFAEGKSFRNLFHKRFLLSVFVKGEKKAHPTPIQLFS